jgi:dihydrolipoamide dehydrogenase
VSVAYTNAKGEAQLLEVDKLIVSIGRVANTIGLNARSRGPEARRTRRHPVDDECKTNLPNVWAIGDVVRGPMLAHKAEEEGVAVAERIAGQHGHVNFNTIPWVIYTSPEIAWVGQTEQQLKAAGVPTRPAPSRSWPTAARARWATRRHGQVPGRRQDRRDPGRAHRRPDGQRADLRSVVAMEFKASAEDIARICHAHPSLSEATKEAALAVDKRTLNF